MDEIEKRKEKNLENKDYPIQSALGNAFSIYLSSSRSCTWVQILSTFLLFQKIIKASAIENKVWKKIHKP